MTEERHRRIAVIGSGVTGLVTSLLLSRKRDITVELYEADERLGGHAFTYQAKEEGVERDGTAVLDHDYAMEHDEVLKSEGSKTVDSMASFGIQASSADSKPSGDSKTSSGSQTSVDLMTSVDSKTSADSKTSVDSMTSLAGTDTLTNSKTSPVDPKTLVDSATYLADLNSSVDLKTSSADSKTTWASKTSSSLNSKPVLLANSRTRPPVDLGFQVYNLTTYPLLTKLFDELGVETEPSEMSFACSNPEWEWASHDLNSFFATRSNLVSPKFYSMIREIFKFAKLAKKDLEGMDDTQTLRDYLKENKFSEYFARDYLLPMTAAVWSVPYKKMLDFPIKALVRFWANHHLLDPLGDRPRWRVVKNRSDDYVQAARRKLESRGVRIHLNTAAQCVSGRAVGGKVEITFKNNGNEFKEKFDKVVFCTHADDTARIMGSAHSTAAERNVLGSIDYEPNRIVLHSDVKFMPRLSRAWASWNVIQQNLDGSDDDRGVCVTYWLNRLQNLAPEAETLLCTLNPVAPIDESKIILDLTLSHPIFDVKALQAQNQVKLMNQEPGRDILFAGAWVDNGFHEDGARAAVRVAEALCGGPDVFGEGWSLTARGPAPVLGSRFERLGLRVFDSVAERFIKKGHFRIVLPSGDEIGPYGRKSRAEAIALKESVCELRVLDVSMFWRIVRDSDIGLGEAYMERLFELPRGHDDLIGLFDMLIENRDAFSELMNSFGAGSGTVISAIASVAYHSGNAIQYVRHLKRANTVEGSRKNIQEHYDLGNDFYKLFLDETMTYSSGIHASKEVSLKDAQLAKYDRIIAKAKLTKSSKVLEIGCGWGGFAQRAYETTGCKVVGITISTEQLAYAKERISKLDCADGHVSLEFLDYRKLPIEHQPASFDAIVSIEMLEAVGHENLPEYFQIVDTMLKPGAPAVVQVIGMPDDRYAEYMATSDFIRRHIFPGGHLPCMTALKDALKSTDLRVGEVFDIGPDYADSLLEWRQRFYAQRENVMKLGMNDMFVRKWLFYFAYCEVGFRRKYIYDWQIVFEKSETPAGWKNEAKASSQSGAAMANNRPKDFVTGAMFGAWFTLCVAAVAERGRHLLIIPFVMMIALMFHQTQSGKKNAYDSAAFPLALVASVVGACGVYAGSFIPSYTAVLIGTGFAAADLFALVRSGAFAPRLVRVAYAALQVSFLGAASFYDENANMFAYACMHIALTNFAHALLYAHVVKSSSKILSAFSILALLIDLVFNARFAIVGDQTGISTMFPVVLGALACSYDVVAIFGAVESFSRKVVE